MLVKDTFFNLPILLISRVTKSSPKSPFYLIPNKSSITVDTPEQLEQLKAGQIGSGLSVFVRPGAHPDPLSQAALVRNDQLLAIHFLDDDLNQMTVWPTKKIAKAFFRTRSYVSSMPTDLYSYAIHFEDGTNATEDDVLRIAQFKDATHLSVYDADNVGKHLLETDALAAMEALETFATNIHPDNFRSVNVARFIKNAASSALRSIALYAHTLSGDDIAEFVKMQELPADYQHRTWDTMLHFEKSSSH